MLLTLFSPQTTVALQGLYHFTNHMIEYSKGTLPPNGTILTEYNTLKPVVYSSVEAETGGTFENAHNVIPL